MLFAGSVFQDLACPLPTSGLAGGDNDNWIMYCGKEPSYSGFLCEDQNKTVKEKEEKAARERKQKRNVFS
jgi:hypothetical protein